MPCGVFLEINQKYIYTRFIILNKKSGTQRYQWQSFLFLNPESFMNYSAIKAICYFQNVCGGAVSLDLKVFSSTN